ncbi:hypothetical protein DPQ33_01125 [Oceanidesulfovibrio indonesiensis]|uniref:Sensory/regulatory protein RpfC n=1 Tax=Oceanidesulfovibrio indonesiensis TaxID=54767 RepID=A0A7M3MJ96_9BACT|nr:PAS domain S-box protein [Oceanidesulfovibrio indonesiensis]TVM19864.1 hypothetical protein DPQ33_01125 [Oceanidesulfovibrio indonesiensis]
MNDTLRNKALEILSRQSGDGHAHEENKILHEMRIHQIELELQNEELSSRQEELLKLKDEYETLFEAAPGGYLLLDGQGAVIKANRTASDMLGAPCGKLLRKPLVIYLDAQDHVRFFSAVNDAVRGASGVVRQLRLKAKTGDISHIRFQVRLLNRSEDSVQLVASLTDISDVAEAQKQLKEAEKQQRSIIQNAGLGIVVVDNRGFHVDVNEAFCRLTGFPRDELLDLGPPFPYWPRQRMDSLRRDLSRIIARGKAQLETTFQTREGREFPVSITASSILSSGNVPKAFICIVQDISELKETHEKLVAAKNAAEAADMAKSRFLANMSHEIRTPISGIMGMLQLALTTRLDDEQRNYLHTAMDSAKGLLTVINDILDFSKIEAGRMEMRSDPVNLERLTQSVTDSFSNQAALGRVGLSYTLGNDLPKRIRGDEGRLRQILNNLIANSIKFTSRGEVRVGLWNISPAPERTRLLLTVEDTGCGIPDKALNRIFDSFAQADDSYSRKHQGAGLGLNIVRGLVQMMGGSLCVESEMERGTAVFISLPVEEVPGQAARSSTSTDTEIEPTGGTRPLKILLAEDNLVNRTFATQLLSRIGHEVVAVENGQAVVEALRKQPFDCVFMDVQMPELDGVETTRLIRAGSDGLPQDTVIVAMTAYAMKGDKEVFLDKGMDFYLSKPLDMKELHAILARVQQLLDKRGS